MAGPARFLRTLAAAATWFSGALVAQAPPNDECSGALPLAVGSTAGTTVGSTTSPGDLTSCFGIQNDVWFSFESPVDGLLFASTAPGDGGSASFDTVLAVYGGTCAELDYLACGDYSSYGGLEAQVVAPVHALRPVLVRLGGHSAVGDFVLAVSFTAFTLPTNDDCEGALPLTLGPNPGWTTGATSSATQPSCHGIANDVWFQFEAPATGLLSVSTLFWSGGSADFPAGLAAYEGNCGQLVQVACNDTINYQPFSSLGVPVQAGQRYFVQLGSFGQTGDFVLAAKLVEGQIPPNDDCESAQLVTAGLVQGDTSLATWSGIKGYCSFVIDKDVWYQWVAPAQGALEVWLLEGGPSVIGSACTAASCTSQYLLCADTYCYKAYGDPAFVAVEAGQVIKLVVGNVEGLTGGPFTLALEFTPAEPPWVFVNPLNGHSYTLTPKPLTWHEAQAWASSVQGHLVTLGDFFEKYWLGQQFSNWGWGEVWIGLTDEESEGDFQWVTGEPLVDPDWAPGEPDDGCFSLGEDYVGMLPANGKWRDFPANGCFTGPKFGLVEIEGQAQLAMSEMVGSGCPALAPVVLFSSPPSLGQLLHLTVADPTPVAAGALFASAVPVNPIPFGSCELQLEVASMFWVTALDTSGIGLGELWLPIPADSSLVGMDVALQAIVLHAHEPALAVSNGLHLKLGY